MSELQEVDVYIDHSGNVRVEIRGAKGKKCLDITKDLELYLGSQVVDRELTDEYNMLSEQENQTDSLNTSRFK